MIMTRNNIKKSSNLSLVSLELFLKRDVPGQGVEVTLASPRSKLVLVVVHTLHTFGLVFVQSARIYPPLVALNMCSILKLPKTMTNLSHILFRTRSEPVLIAH